MFNLFIPKFQAISDLSLIISIYMENKVKEKERQKIKQNSWMKKYTDIQWS